MPALTFLKLGGSLITEKHQPHTPRNAIIERIAGEIASAFQPEKPLLIGHGSGSFGHVSANRYQTRQGVHTPDQWRGFAEVWRDARALNEILMAALTSEGLPVIAFPPSAMLTTTGGHITAYHLAPLRSALEHGLIPVVQGDVAFDDGIGGTIVSTEQIFQYLAPQLKPDRILLAGIEPGVWADFPTCRHLLTEFTPSTDALFRSHLQGSAAVDVTGGMAEKVNSMLQLCSRLPELKAWIFSGESPDSVTNALCGKVHGTLIHL